MVKNKLNNCQASRHGPWDEVQVRDQQMGVSLSPVLAQQARTLSIHQASSFFSPSHFFLFSWCFTSTETIRLIWDGDGSRKAASTFTPHTPLPPPPPPPRELLQMLLYVTETIRFIRGGEPRTATSIRLSHSS